MKLRTAIFISVAFHAALAVLIAAWIRRPPASPDTAATLDLSTVELSFANEEDDTSSAQTSVESAAASAPEQKPPRPKDELPRPKLPPLAHEPDRAPDEPRLDERIVPPNLPALPNLPKRETPAPPSQVTAAPAPRQAHVDAPPRPRTNLRPDYPRGARLRQEQGDVRLRIAVGADGGVGEVRVVRGTGYADLDEAAVKAARKARFSPAKSGENAVPSTVEITLRFRLRD